MRVALAAFVAVVLFVAYAVWDEPTKEERALAARASAFMSARYGTLPLHSNAAPAAGGKTYGLRPAHHGRVVFITYGLTGSDERTRLRAVATQALAEVPGLQAVSLESYEANVIAGKARFHSSETVQR